MTKTRSARSAADPYPIEHHVPGGSQLSGWLSLAALVVAVIAVALAVVVWFRPMSGAASGHFTDQQSADAKANVCGAYLSVRKAVVINTHLNNPVQGDQIGALAVAANARLALYGGGDYLRQRLHADPATPDDLAKAVGSMADTLEKLSIGYLSGAPELAQDPLRRDLDGEIKQINGLCG